MNKLSATLSFALLCGLSLLAERRALAATLSLALNREEYTQILLVLPIAAALIFLDREVFKSPATPGLAWGSALCLVSRRSLPLAQMGARIST